MTARTVPEYVLTTTPDPAFGHLTKSPTVDDVVRDMELLKPQFPDAVIWRRDPDGTMTKWEGT